MKRILVTGFDPFDHDAVNPSGELLQFLKGKSANHQLSFLCLPVTFNEAFNKLKVYTEELRPDLLIMTGFAKNRTLISLEKVALNWIDARIPDNNNLLLTQQKIIEAAPNAIFSSLPLENLKTQLNELSSSIRFEMSYTAGTYVCNEVYFKAMNEFKIPQTFIHLPGKSTMTKEQIFESILDFLNLLE